MKIQLRKTRKNLKNSNLVYSLSIDFENGAYYYLEISESIFLNLLSSNQFNDDTQNECYNFERNSNFLFQLYILEDYEKISKQLFDYVINCEKAAIQYLVNKHNEMILSFKEKFEIASKYEAVKQSILGSTLFKYNVISDESTDFDYTIISDVELTSNIFEGDSFINKSNEIVIGTAENLDGEILFIKGSIYGNRPISKLYS